MPLFPRNGDVLLEHICSAPELFLSYCDVQAGARAASVFWDITSLYQGKAALMSAKSVRTEVFPACPLPSLTLIKETT